MKQSEVLISVVIPLYNEEEIIDTLYSRCTQAMNAWCDNYEIICVNDGSTDNTLNLLLEHHHKDPKFKVISLSRNFGHQASFLCGLKNSSGSFIAMIDGDLQDPPEMLENFYQKMEEGFDIVYGVRRKRKEGFFKKLSYKLYYVLLNNISSIPIPLDSGDFSMIRRNVLSHMVEIQEKNLFIRGVRSWVGFRQYGYEYERDARYAGETKYTLKKLLILAYNGIFSFSQFPVKILARIGFVVIIISIFYSLFALYTKVTQPDVPQGFTTLAIAIFLFSGIQLMALGIIGEYVLRIYDESRNRPHYIESEKYF
jgi:glycosyltransferase involved in cell wall biosynthesis